MTAFLMRPIVFLNLIMVGFFDSVQSKNNDDRKGGEQMASLEMSSGVDVLHDVYVRPCHLAKRNASASCSHVHAWE